MVSRSAVVSAAIRSQRCNVTAHLQVYVWGRRHPYVSLSFLGVFTFSAPYLPWVLLGFSIVLRSSPVVDLCGMVAGQPLPHTLSSATGAAAAAWLHSS